MNFIILGAGAIGCYVGGRLAHAGQNLSLVLPELNPQRSARGSA